MKLLDITRTIEDRLINQEFTFEFEHGESYTKYECDFTINSVEVDVGYRGVSLEARANGRFMNEHGNEITVVLVLTQGLSMEQLELEIEELDGELEVE